jgi:hypothetical protein
MTEITNIADRITEKGEYSLIPETRRVKRITRYSPNILAVVNFSDNPNRVITRGYIFNICFEEAYGNLETAVRHFVLNSSRQQGFTVQGEGKNETREPLLYLLGFVKGKNWSKLKKKGEDEKSELDKEKVDNGKPRIDRDIVYFPFEQCDEERKAKANPFMVKSSIHEDIGTGGISTTFPNLMGDLFPLLELEERNRLILTQEEFRDSFPDLSSLGIRYI